MPDVEAAPERSQDQLWKEVADRQQKLVVMFIDMAGSTAFKHKHPETWVRRLHRFLWTISEWVNRHGGVVVKYIGDEVMATFQGASAPQDVTGLLGQIDSTQQDLEQSTGHPTLIKTAVDYGEVYMFQFRDHEALDPQGTVVDRCARIAKHAKPGTALASSQFVDACDDKDGRWHELGERLMPGLEKKVKVFQLDGDDVDIHSLPPEAANVFWTGAGLMAAVVKLQQLELLRRLEPHEQPHGPDGPDTLLRSAKEYLDRGIQGVEAMHPRLEAISQLQTIRQEIAGRDVESWDWCTCHGTAQKIHNILGEIQKLPDDPQEESGAPGT